MNPRRRRIRRLARRRARELRATMAAYHAAIREAYTRTGFLPLIRFDQFTGRRTVLS